LPCTRNSIVLRIAEIGWRQGDDLVGLAGSHEGAHAGEAGLVNAHAEGKVPLIQHRHQPAGGIAAIKQQQIGDGEAVKVLEQHLAPTVAANASQRRG